MKPLYLTTRTLSGTIAALPTALVLSLAMSTCGGAQETDGAGPQASSPAGGGPRKLALVVAIADYASASGWTDLSSDRDLKIIKAALERQGFDPILELTDGEATGPGIKKAFQALIDRAETGDVAYFHYSGHGHQLTDDDHDEEDGYDEVLVPHDAPMEPLTDYRGEKHVRDDELNVWLKQLRRKIGKDGEVVVSLDSCFSGTGTRGEANARGHDKPIGERQPREQEAGPADAGAGYLEGSAGARGAGGDGDADLAPLVALSAARHDELAFEHFDATGDTVGSLSLALSAVLAEAGPGLTYRSAFEQIKNLMAGYRVRNTPQAEGSGLDNLLFSGQAVEQEPFFTVLMRSKKDDRKVQLAGGTVVGLFPGTRVEIHPAGTHAWQQAEAIARGKIVKAKPLTTEVELESAVDAEEIKGTWAYVTAQAFGPLAITARIEPEDAAWAGAVKERLANSESKLVTIGDDADVVIREVAGANGKSRVVVETTHDAYPLLAPTLADRQLASRVAERLTDYARNRYLRRLELQSEEFKVEFDILPCQLECHDFGDCDKSRTLAADEVTAAGNLELTEGMAFEIDIHNRGEKEAFITILDLMPTGEWAVLWPPPNQNQVPVPAGASHKVDDLWQVGPPYGSDVLKVFASRQPIDFRWLLGPSQGSRGEEPQNPLEELFKGVLGEGEGVRGSKSVTVGTGVATASRTFRILQEAALD